MHKLSGTIEDPVSFPAWLRCFTSPTLRVTADRAIAVIAMNHG